MTVALVKATFAYILTFPHRLAVAKVKASFLLLWVTQVKRGAGANMVNVPAVLSIVIPRHTFSELCL